MTTVVPDLPAGRSAPKPEHRTGIRVAAVPAGHVYVRHPASLTARDPVRLLPDPCPRGTPRSRWGWWPPAMLDPDWVRRHHDESDLLHLHQGCENASPVRLTALVRLLRRLGKPLVFTLHYLKNLPANVAAVPLVEVLARTVADLPDARLRIDLHANAPDGVVLRRVTALAGHR